MNNWKEFTISNIIVEQSKSKLQVQNAIDHGSYPFFTSGERILKHTEYIAEGDNIFLATGGVANVKYFSGKCAYSTDTYVLKCIDFDTKYLYYFLLDKRDFINNNLFSGSGLKHLQKKDFYKICFKAPGNSGEQQKIVKILSTADTVLEKTQTALAKYKAIKEGLLNDLFTRGIDLKTGKLRPKQEEAPELYKESELGWIPKDWEMDKLEFLTEKIGSGVTPTGGSEVYVKSGVLFLRSQNILIGKLNIEDAAYINSEIDEKMEGSRIKQFDVLLNITGASIGRCAYFPFELISANVNQHVCIIRFKNSNKSHSVFASEFMNSHFGQSQINRSNAGGNREGLNFQQIKSFSFPIINPLELDIIASIIERQSFLIGTEENYLEKLQRIKSGLLADLLSGNKIVTA